MSSEAERSGRPIAWSILALVLTSVLVATLVYFAVTFRGPPPRNPPRGVAAIARALEDGNQPNDNGPPLRIHYSRFPPSAMGPELDDRPAAEQVAAVLGRPASDVVARVTARSPGLSDAFVDGFAFGLRQADGRWRIVEGRPLPNFNRWHGATLVAMLLTLAALAVPGWWIARALSRPLRELASAAQVAQAGAKRPDFPVGGPEEVRALTTAVSAMHDRLTHHAEARTAMLAAIAHDLGTPLSRLAFWIEQLPDVARERAGADIGEMRAMISDTLGFARDEVGARENGRIELASLIEALVDDMQMAGSPVTAEGSERAVIRGDAGALRRVFANLFENAIRYGARARVDWQIVGDRVRVDVQDDGPGIDPAEAERLFEPFVRGDPSRNRATGGTGLGLAIVRSIVVRHGGGVTLSNGIGGGALATVTLPLAS